MEILILKIIALLITKHFIVDFLLQGEYQWRNKGTLGHPGGILHAGLHGITTAICIAPFHVISYWLLIGLAISDMVIHYFVDWAKMNINKLYGWKADQHSQFWYLLGLDQFMHYFTYVGILAVIVDFNKN